MTSEDGHFGGVHSDVVLVWTGVACLGGGGQVSLTPSALAVGRLHLDWTVHLERKRPGGTLSSFLYIS